MASETPPVTRAAALAALVVVAAVSLAGRADRSALRLGAWVTYWDMERGLDRLRAAPRAGGDVFFFVAELGADGLPSIVPPALSYREAVEEVRDAGWRPWLTVVNDRRSSGGPAILKDAATVHEMLLRDAARARHRAAIVALAEEGGFAGVDVDYENLLAEDRERFSGFVRELSGDLEGRGLLLSVTVQPKNAESLSPGPGAADWAALCQATDRLQIMLYSLHSARTGPGPMATAEWMREVLSFAGDQCPRSRIIPVLKVSGMDWGSRGAVGIQYLDAMALAALHRSPVAREGEEATPYFHYEAGDGRHTVYFEDARSIDAKVRVLAALGHDDVVLWSLGREDPMLLSHLILGRSL